MSDDSDVVIIPLSRGDVTVVDTVDAELAAQLWHSSRRGSNSPYARRTESVFIHRLIASRKLGRELLPLEEVDHIDGDGLNNRRDNLRLATHRQNLRNRRANSGSTSHYLGVSWCSTRNKWKAQISVSDESGACRNTFLGRFDDEADAARAYNDAAFRLFGEFSNLNRIGVKK